MRLPAPPKLDNAVAAPLLALLLTAAAPPLLLSPSPALAAASASPTSTELSRLSAGLARVAGGHFHFRASPALGAGWGVGALAGPCVDGSGPWRLRAVTGPCRDGSMP